ncbi:hypothetical protein CK222_18090 [Mesorhizobium sp. WSM3866]|nr:hypothetical protein CK222_18090 [Mesorhizobium sp. WSM3866]
MKACLPIGMWEGSGLLLNHLLMVVMVVPAMMLVVVVLYHRGRIGAGRAEDRRGECQGQSQPERGEEGLLHDFVSFYAGVPEFTGPNR